MARFIIDSNYRSDEGQGDIEPLDFVSFALASAVLLLVALCACAGPAWRAAAIDPSTTLRRE